MAHQTYPVRSGAPSAMKFGRLTWSNRSVVCAMLVLASGLLGQAAHAVAPITVGGPFTLQASDGSKVTDRTYRGKWLLVYFGYTSCPDSCPTTLYQLAAALTKLGKDAAKVQPIFITVDPQRDTPQRIGDYVQSFGPRLVGLTGTADEVEAVTKAYGAYSVRHTTGPGPQDYSIDHSIYVYLMSPEGKFVRAFDADWSAERIAAAVHRAVDMPAERALGGRTP